MFHVTHFILFFAFSIGLVATLLSFQIYFKYRFKYLLSGSIALICINSIILINIAMLYFYFNLYRESSINLILTVTTIFTIAMPILYIVAVYFFYSWIDGLLHEKQRQKFGKFFYVLCLSVFIFQLISSYMNFSIKDIPLNYIVFKTVEFLALIMAFIIIVITIKSSNAIENYGRQVSFKRFCRIIMAVLICSILLNIGYFLKEISSDVYLLLLALLMLCGNIIPIYYYKWFLIRYFEDHGTYAGDGRPKIDIVKLCQDYNVTSREQEIIRLICDGKTNNEVAEILFISLQTVKDHIYRIYKKVGVKNRVQLTNMFKGE